MALMNLLLFILHFLFYFYYSRSLSLSVSLSLLISEPVYHLIDIALGRVPVTNFFQPIGLFPATFTCMIDG